VLLPSFRAFHSRSRAVCSIFFDKLFQECDNIPICPVIIIVTVFPIETEIKNSCLKRDGYAVHTIPGPSEAKVSSVRIGYGFGLCLVVVGELPTRRI